jgi:CRP/FNR family transcriptional regulator
MAVRKLSPNTRSNKTGVPKRSFSDILPNLPIKFSEGLLANAKPRSLTERDAMAAASFLTVKAGSRALCSNLRSISVARRKPDELSSSTRQTDIAAMAGVARENVSRTMTELKRRGLIGQSSSYYFINDKRKLLRETEDIV